MSIKPILMNTEMVRALLDGRKTVTRLVVNGAHPEWTEPNLEIDPHMIAVHMRGIHKGEIYPKKVNGLYVSFDNGTCDFPMIKAPYRPGDVLYVRETWSNVNEKSYYRADDKENIGVFGGWRPSIHMPREAARIWLRVTDVRVERLREITCGDCLKEGIRLYPGEPDSADVFRQKYSALWDSTIKPADREKYGWAANPWVWVVEFARCEKPEEG